MIGWFCLSYTNHCNFVVFFVKCTIQSSDTKHIFKTNDFCHKINSKVVYLISLIVHLKLSTNSIFVMINLLWIRNNGFNLLKCIDILLA